MVTNYFVLMSRINVHITYFRGDNLKTFHLQLIGIWNQSDPFSIAPANDLTTYHLTSIFFIVPRAQ